MPKSFWPPELAPIGYQAFKSTFQHITETMPRRGGTIASQSVRAHFDAPLNRGAFVSLDPTDDAHLSRDSALRRAEWRRRIEVMRRHLPTRRGRVDPLFGLLRAWAAAELAPIATEEWKYRGKTIWRQRVTDIPTLRRRISGASREMVALGQYGYTVSELVRLATMGDDVSLFALVALDKAVLTSAFVQKRIRIAASYDDREFFGQLGKTLTQDTYRNHNPSVRRAIAVYLAWFLGFERLPRKDLKDFLVAERLDSHGSPGSTNALLYRLGLSKPRANSSSKKSPKSR